jgi:hypothetical protein
MKNEKVLEKFAILCEGVDKKEIKKARDYMRANGIDVLKNKDEVSVYANAPLLRYDEDDKSFQRYYDEGDCDLLQMSQDWNKLVKYVEEYKGKNPVSIMSINFGVGFSESRLIKIHNANLKPKPLFTNTLGDKFLEGEMIWYVLWTTKIIIKRNINDISSDLLGKRHDTSQIYKTEKQAKEDLLNKVCPEWEKLVENNIITINK